MMHLACKNAGGTHIFFDTRIPLSYIKKENINEQQT